LSWSILFIALRSFNVWEPLPPIVELAEFCERAPSQVARALKALCKSNDIWKIKRDYGHPQYYLNPFKYRDGEVDMPEEQLAAMIAMRDTSFIQEN
jgi:hypothetical protein